MKFLYDFFPILFFFATFKIYGIFVATAVAIVASTLQVGIFWFRHRRFETMHLVTLALIIVFGGATLLLHDEMFIKWKPTILNWLFGVVFLASQFIGKRPIIQRMLAKTITLPERVWTRLNLGWTVFFVSIGFVNLYVVYNFDTDTWVNFKLFGMLGLTVAFVIGQSFYLARYLKTDEGPEGKNQ